MEPRTGGDGRLQERTGLSCISGKPFPVPDGSKVIPAFSADFENGALGTAWAN